MKIPSNILTLIAGIALTIISLWYGQNHGLMPIAASQDASDVDDLFNFMITIATGLFLIIEGVLVFCIIKFRRKKGDKTDGPAIEGNVPLEIFWTAIPTVIVLILSIYSFEIYNQMGGLDPMASHDMARQDIAHHQGLSENNNMIALDLEHQKVALGIGRSPNTQAGVEPLLIDVKGIQYAWIFTYPDTGIVSGEIHVPVDRPVRLNIQAGDVLHAFWLPEFRIKQDAIPGRDSELAFTPNKTGAYPVICAELCGAYHGGMKTKMYVETEEQYSQWVQQNTIAQADHLEESVAINSTNKSSAEFLAPYVEDMGIQSETLKKLKALHTNPSSI